MMAAIQINTPNMKLLKTKIQTQFEGTTDLCFVLKGEDIVFDQWQFK